jgi:hypothetical protein
LPLQGRQLKNLLYDTLQKKLLRNDGSTIESYQRTYDISIIMYHVD